MGHASPRMWRIRLLAPRRRCDERGRKCCPTKDALRAPSPLNGLRAKPRREISSSLAGVRGENDDALTFATNGNVRNGELDCDQRTSDISAMNKGELAQGRERMSLEQFHGNTIVRRPRRWRWIFLDLSGGKGSGKAAF